MDEDGDQEHRGDGKVLEWPDHHGVRHRGVGRRAHRPEDPAPERAEGGHRTDGQSAEENVSGGGVCVSAFMFTLITQPSEELFVQIFILFFIVSVSESEHLHYK